ncbi:hypothetical protein AMTR_s00045p00211160 [Amborella trichopoda]|uniref:Transposase MuDR plant domain-containing protein n=1 Tax=Amborella trichopoda TaxID=13333 RepID=W1P3L0_AMBTC|nr:hypothetical protein AMTR_s00045p00211160 [Amborella trichopoda]
MCFDMYLMLYTSSHSCPNEPVTVPVTNNEVQEYESKSEHELQIQRDGDNLEPSGSRHTSKCMQVGLCVGQDFDTVKELRDYLVDYAIHENFIVKYLRNDQERVIAFCAGEGCSWRVRCSKVGSTKIFRVREMINEHTCGRLMGTAHQPLARSQWVAKKIKARLNDQMDLTPKDIANVVQNDHGVPLSYMQAWRGIEAARAMILGSEAQSYRPKKQRKPTKVKDARAYYCKHCGALGHNKRTCKEPIHNMMPETSAQASGPASSVRTST